jgi:SHS2 domain-containing protein
MGKDSKTKRVNVTFRVNLDVGMEISASSLEEALEKARAMNVTDVIDFTGLDHNDSSIQVVGAWTLGIPNC